MKYLLAVSFFVGCSTFLWGQNYSRIDSLTNSLRSASELDSISIYQDLAIQWVDFDNLRCFSYTKLAHQHAVECGDSAKIIKSLTLMGLILRRLERVDSAIHVFSAVIHFAKRHQLTEDLITVYSSLGGINLFAGRYDQCLKYYNMVLNMPGIENRQMTKRTVLFNTGLLYYKILDFERALEYDFKALALLKEAGDPTKEIPQLLVNISLCYINTRHFAKGEYYIKQAMNECGATCSEYLKMQVSFNYGMLYLEQKRYKLAEPYFLKSYPMAIRQHDARFQLDNIERLCEIYLANKRFSQVKHFLAKADSILPTVTLNSEAEKIYKQHMRLYSATRDVQKLADYQRKYLQAHDSVFSTKLAVNLTRMEADYQRREAATELGNQERIIGLKDSFIKLQHLVIALASSLVILLILFLLFFIKRTIIKKEANRLLEEKVKERTANFANSLAELNLRLHSSEEHIRRILSETCNAMASIEVLSSLLLEDGENKILYATDIKKLSQKVVRNVEAFQSKGKTNETSPGPL